ncbi:MAG: methyltransferase domain-containing protein [Armatimonadetes bacterium]|nr:methyltransferase domain-containing protein [Armatimonadota bacterium]
MDRVVFERFRDLIYDRSGILLRDGKEVLVAARVGKRMRSLGLEHHSDYYQHVVNDQSGTELTILLDAISTNTTSFYRERDHFEQMTGYLTAWLAEGRTRLRLWCAASSTGEEPYTIAITVKEALAGRAVDARILATDINTQVLEQAQVGEYEPEKVHPVPPELRQKYFAKVQRPKGTMLAVGDELKQLLAFRRMNLAETPYPLKGPLDLIICRNVMIYFDNTVRQRFLDEAFRLLRPSGILMVGHAESLTGLTGGFKPVRPSVYIKPA